MFRWPYPPNHGKTTKSFKLKIGFFNVFLSFFYFRVYDIEERIKTPRKFRFPQFEPVNWLAAQKLKNDLSDLNSDSTLCPSHLLSGIKALLQALKSWLPDLETKVRVLIYFLTFLSVLERSLAFLIFWNQVVILKIHDCEPPHLLWCLN